MIDAEGCKQCHKIDPDADDTLHEDYILNTGAYAEGIFTSKAFKVSIVCGMSHLQPDPHLSGLANPANPFSVENNPTLVQKQFTAQQRYKFALQDPYTPPGTAPDYQAPCGN